MPNANAARLGAVGRLDRSRLVAQAASDPIARLWCAALEAPSAAVLATVDAAAAEARRDGDAWNTIELAALGSFVAGSLERLDDAVARARTAARMARSEGIWPCTLAAGWALARARRLSGRPHLGLHIVRSLTAAGDAEQFETLLGLEQSLTGGNVAVGLGAAVTDAIQTREAASFDALEIWLGGQPPLLADIVAARGCLAVPGGTATSEVQAFVEGRGPIPRGLSAVVGASDDLQRPFAWISVGPGAPARRSLALPDVSPSLASPRVAALLAALAWAWPASVEVPDLFAAIYGFAYAPTHDSVFRMLVHRARAAVEERGAIERVGGGLRLAPLDTLWLADPASVPTLEECLLRVLAMMPQATTRQLADRCSVPQRSVQRALRSLADEGAVRASRHERGVYYQVEDTTFVEPTARGTL